MNDSQIIELYFQRSENAIAQTEQKYKNLCFSISNNILNNIEDSEECVNDTFLSVWNNIPPAKPENLRAYVCKIARNTALKRLDYNSAQKRSGEFAVSLSELEEVIPDNRIRPDADDEELGRLISKFLLKQPAAARKVFVRKYYFFDSVSEIAERYSYSESKVKNLLYRTRTKLRGFLKKEGVEI